MSHRSHIMLTATLLFIVICPALLISCNHKNGNSFIFDNNSVSTTGTISNYKTVLDYYIWKDEESYITPVIDAYCALKPSIKINLHVLKSSTYDDEMKKLIQSNTKIDLLGIRGISSMVQFKDMGALLDLTSYILNNDMDVTAYGNMFNDIDIDGKYYGIPTRSTCWFLLYNKDIFDKAGLDYPGQITWDEYRKLAISLTQGEGDSKIYGGYWVPWCYNFAALQQSSYLIDDDLTYTRESLELLNNFYNIDKSHMDYSIVNDDKTNYLTDFEKGNIAMMPQGEWVINMLLQDEKLEIANINWDIAPMPVFKRQEPGITWGQYQSVSIESGSAYPKESFDFIQFLCGEEGARIYADHGIIHAYCNGEIKKEYLHTVGKKSASILFKAKKVQEEVAVSGYEDIKQALKDCAKEYLLGNKSIDETMTEFKKKRDKILNP